MKTKKLDRRWKQHTQDYVIARETRPVPPDGLARRDEHQGSSNGVTQADLDAGIVRVYPDPQFPTVTVAFKVYHLPTRHAVEIDDHGNHDEFLRTIFEMIDAGVKVVEGMPDVIFSALYAEFAPFN